MATAVFFMCVINIQTLFYLTNVASHFVSQAAHCEVSCCTVAAPDPCTRICAFRNPTKVV